MICIWVIAVCCIQAGADSSSSAFRHGGMFGGGRRQIPGVCFSTQLLQSGSAHLGVPFNEMVSKGMVLLDIIVFFLILNR
jgi:hypothetical protein